MSQDDRDRSLKEHLTKTVLGTRFREKFGMPHINLDLDSWADAGMAWDKARERGLRISLYGGAMWCGVWHKAIAVQIATEYVSGPRALCEAIALATGWEDPKDAD